MRHGALARSLPVEPKPVVIENEGSVVSRGATRPYGATGSIVSSCSQVTHGGDGRPFFRGLLPGGSRAAYEGAGRVPGYHLYRSRCSQALDRGRGAPARRTRARGAVGS